MYPSDDFDSSTEAIPPSTWQYVEMPGMALDYDRYFSGTRLFEFDKQVLDEMFTRPGRLLDMGCGSGRHVMHFARRGFDVTGLDLSGHMLAVAEKKLQTEGLSAELVRQDMCDLTRFEPASFDYVICMFSTLGLIRGRAHRLNVLREVRRVLKPGGKFVFHVHNRWHNLLDSEGRWWLLRTYLAMPAAGFEVGDKIMENYRLIRGMYLHIFSLGEVRRMVRRSGMILHDVIYLSRSRDERLPPGLLGSVRANGFLVVAEA